MGTEVAVKHTPGPWDSGLDRIGTLGGPTVRAANGHYICDVRTSWPPRVGGDVDAGCVANARLIAAAPDLLAACQQAALQLEYLAEKFTPTGSGANVLAQLRTAIDKATTP